MDLIIKHKPGKNNSNADALSRCSTQDEPTPNPIPEDNRVCSVDLSSEDFQSDLLDLASLSTQKADEEIAVMLSYLTNGELPSDKKKNTKDYL